MRYLAKAHVRLLVWLNAVAAAFVLILMFLIAADVTGRYAFNRPVYGSTEIAQSLLVFIVFLGWAWTQHQKGHIRIQMVTSRLPRRWQLLADGLAHAIGLIIFSFIVFETTRQAIQAWEVGEQTAGMVRVPLWPARFAVSVGSFMLAVQFAADAWTDVKRFVKQDVKE